MVNIPIFYVSIAVYVLVGSLTWFKFKENYFIHIHPLPESVKWWLFYDVVNTQLVHHSAKILYIPNAHINRVKLRKST